VCAYARKKNISTQVAKIVCVIQVYINQAAEFVIPPVTKAASLVLQPMDAPNAEQIKILENQAFVFLAQQIKSMTQIAKSVCILGLKFEEKCVEICPTGTEAK
jgi:hypothetical protein